MGSNNLSCNKPPRPSNLDMCLSLRTVVLDPSRWSWVHEIPHIRTIKSRSGRVNFNSEKSFLSNMFKFILQKIQFSIYVWRLIFLKQMLCILPGVRCLGWGSKQIKLQKAEEGLMEPTTEYTDGTHRDCTVEPLRPFGLWCSALISFSTSALYKKFSISAFSRTYSLLNVYPSPKLFVTIELQDLVQLATFPEFLAFMYASCFKFLKKICPSLAQ